LPGGDGASFPDLDVAGYLPWPVLQAAEAVAEGLGGVLNAVPARKARLDKGRGAAGVLLTPLPSR
jgi:hypothetical protein